jgi:hypothetical protein
VSISEQAKSQISRLVDLGRSLDPHDSDQVDLWARASYEALRFDPVRQAKFDEYCCSPWGPAPTRVCLGVWMLSQPLNGRKCALSEDILEERLIPWEHSCWLRG